MSGGDLTIDGGDYCPNCREADALHCMATGPCAFRDLARAIVALDAMIVFPEPDDMRGVVLEGDDVTYRKLGLREWLGHTWLAEDRDEIIRRAAQTVLASLNPGRA